MGLSLWLAPEGLSRDRLARLIGDLARRHGTPAFEPHLTLLGGLSGPEDDALRRAAEAAARLAPLSVRLTRLDQGAEYYRSLFAEVARTPELLAARRAAEEAFERPPDPEFLPHVSLLYGDLPREAKTRLLAELGPEARLEFTASALFLFATDGEPREWRRVDRLPLG